MVSTQDLLTKNYLSAFSINHGLNLNAQYGVVGKGNITLGHDIYINSQDNDKKNGFTLCNRRK